MPKTPFIILPTSSSSAKSEAVTYDYQYMSSISISIVIEFAKENRPRREPVEYERLVLTLLKN
jgi:hypothetical protein